jgi:hypothetical protein
MASYAKALKSARMQAVVNAIDGDLAPAYMELGTADMAVIMVTITLSDPSFTESNAVITMNDMPKWGTALVPGTVVEARIRDGGGNIIVSGLTVGLGIGSDIILDFVDLAVDQTVTLSQASISHSP